MRATSTAWLIMKRHFPNDVLVDEHLDQDFLQDIKISAAQMEGCHRIARVQPEPAREVPKWQCKQQAERAVQDMA